MEGCSFTASAPRGDAQVIPIVRAECSVCLMCVCLMCVCLMCVCLMCVYTSPTALVTVMLAARVLHSHSIVSMFSSLSFALCIHGLIPACLLSFLSLSHCLVPDFSYPYVCVCLPLLFLLFLSSVHLLPAECQPKLRGH